MHIGIFVHCRKLCSRYEPTPTLDDANKQKDRNKVGLLRRGDCTPNTKLPWQGSVVMQSLVDMDTAHLNAESTRAAAVVGLEVDWDSLGKVGVEVSNLFLS